MNVVTERQLGGDRVSPAAATLTRTCARPGCSAPAAATLAFFYGEREVCLERLGLDELPATYDLCATHADRMRPPYGWVMNDRRSGQQTADAHHASSKSQDEPNSLAGTTGGATDPSRSIRWLGLAVEAKVAFYGPGLQELDASPPAGDRAPHERRAADAADAEADLVDPEPAREGPDGVGLGGPPRDESGLDPGPEEVRSSPPGFDEITAAQDVAQDDFVPVRARSW